MVAVEGVEVVITQLVAEEFGCDMQCLHPLLLPDRVAPCGKCINCLRNRQRDWYVRLSVELLVSSSAYFVTLTYDDSFLNFVDGVPVVSRRDCQTFFKRLRKRIEPEKIRYFLCSEYGPSTLRPHYHCVIFNFPINLDAYEIINESWKKGFVSVSTVTSARLNYLSKYVVCGYILPDVYKSKQFRPFSLQSRQPGIGCSYLSARNIDRHRALLQTTLPIDGVQKPLPRYYRDRIFNDDEKRVISELSRSSIASALFDYQRLNYNDNPLDVGQFDRAEQYNLQHSSKQIKSGRIL